MKKGDVIEGIISEVRFPNKGIMKAEGMDCIVKNTLPGQKVRIRVNKMHHGKPEAVLLEVLEPAACEQESGCPQFGLCGGCSYLTLPYGEECALKEKQVKRLLIQSVREAAAFLPEEVLKQNGSESLQDAEEYVNTWFEGILPSPVQYEYRNKMEFSFGDAYKDGPMELGMHKRGSFYDIVTVDRCRIIDEDYRMILLCVRDYFRETGLPFYHRLRHEGYLRHLLVRKAVQTGEILVDLITSSQIPDGISEEEILKGMTDRLLALPLNGCFAGILHTANDALSDTIRDDGTKILYGQDYFTEKLLGLSFRVTPFSFFQTNSRSAEVLYETARSYMEIPVRESGKKPVIFDLYCGTGTITQLMAPAAERVIGVEIVEEAVEAARKNAKLNRVNNCEFIAGDVLKVLDEVAEKPDLIILDPPRDGIHPKALPKILSYGVPYILYISCKPTSLARDLQGFLAAGYRPVRGCCVDQFPWTTGIESMCLLIKQNVNHYIKVGIDDEEYFKIKVSKKEQ